MQKFQKQVESEFVQLLEHLIVTKSWWDTVDALAAHAVGTHFARFPQVRTEYLQRWRSADNFWLRRTTPSSRLDWGAGRSFSSCAIKPRRTTHCCSR